MKVNVNKHKARKNTIRQIRCGSGDWFKCQNQNCGYTVRMLVLGNTATCSQCGGRMVRI